ncbi:prepilin-type N-terminal cleavage/methylation domain-containing protein [Acetobacterium paludosum]|uniref:Prepilin-type N-terminal cleavage/methylation domain-containing protein n=1 Tax=Acetobacterium paludosum TaxID=52693 RepID=A0A923KTB9_9FIRM|nr:type II secretion system protein [Acetobacterium paludosum]MBC3889252.1 prepilin-type N-terminal cleavage/methylation domain-containing protein [Acetobacterium paludosum]
MEFINRMRKDKKGFTLVEIIVVLVILAILAAFTIPSMLGFVGDAKKKAAISEQREVYIAAQAIATEQFAKNTPAIAEANLGMTSATVDGVDALKLGSLAVAAVAADATSGADYDMMSYLKGDIIANKGAITGTSPVAAETANSTWTVKISSDGHVKEVTYTKNGVTLDPLVPSSAVK